MSVFDYLVSLTKQGLLKFLGLIILSNRDYPYHDFKSYDDGDEPTSYRVGYNNVNAHGDQSKYFIAKSTMVLSDVVCTIRFNHSDNTPITIRANTQYEFFSNITRVFVDAIGTDGYLDLGFEGVLPNEGRDAE